MIYQLQHTIPIETAKETPNFVYFPLARGIIKQLTILIPPGGAGLAGVRIYRYNHQIFPIQHEGWFIGDDVKMQFDLEVDLIKEPYKLDCWFYNLDDTYPHTLTLLVAVDDLTKLSPVERLIRLLSPSPIE